MSGLPHPVWGQLGGESLAAIGTGMTLPFLLVYLERVRGIELRFAGLTLTALALAGFVGNPLGGTLCDRAGARRTLVAGLVACATGAVTLAFVREPWHACAAATLFGLGAAIVWPAQDALLAALSPSSSCPARSRCATRR
jgi:MFS family permease